MMTKGQLEVSLVGGGGPLSLDSAWLQFSSETSDISSPERFASLYATYDNLRKQGWVVKMGQTYGGHFVIYQGDPDYYHSAFCVLVRNASGEERWNWLDVTREMRVASQTSKELMICDVELEEDATIPACKAKLDYAIMLRWRLKHEQVGREHQPHNKLKRKLIDPSSKNKHKGGGNSKSKNKARKQTSK